MNEALKAETLHLALDQGGHASRAFVFDNHGQLRAQADSEIDTLRFDDQRVEHDPEAVLCSLMEATGECLAQLGHQASIRSAGLATQRSSIVCWDRVTGKALSNVISWQDRRAADWVLGLSKHRSTIHAKTGLMLSPHYGASKLRWCLNNLPSVAEGMARGTLSWGPLASFVLHRLLRERPLLVDPANASRTLLWDYTTGDWSEQLLKLFQLPSKPLPRCVPSRHLFGHLGFTHQAIPLTVTTGDQSAALFALGPPVDDTIYVNIGTGAFVQQLAGNKPVLCRRLLSSILFQDGHEAQYVLEGTINGAGSAIRLQARILGLDMDYVESRTEDWLSQAQTPPLFLNGVSGLGAPFWVPEFPTEVVGKGAPHEQLVAVMESIVFLIKANIDELGKCLSRPKRIMVSGGLAAVDQLCHRIADLTEIRVERPKLSEATARGLGFLVAGAKHWVPPGPAVSFPPQENRSFQERFAIWRQLLDARLSELKDQLVVKNSNAS